MSTSKLTKTNKSEKIRTVPCTIGKSLARIASIVNRPIPFIAKIVSVNTAPPRNAPNSRPTTVTTGINAFLSACRYVTTRSLNPFAGGTYIILPNNFKHRRPGHSCNNRSPACTERNDRQDHLLPVVTPSRWAHLHRTQVVSSHLQNIE